jgi:transcription elongation factor GreA
MKKKIKLTKEGLQALKDELHELKTVKLPSILERLKRARAMGDLRENSEYSASKEDQAMADGRIFELEMLIKNSEIIDVASDSNIVHLGCSVDVERDGTKETYYIVGEYEADPMNKKLSEISDTLFSPENIKEQIWDYATEAGRGVVLWPMRTALTGKERSPDPFTVAALLGKEKTLIYLKKACDTIRG